MGLEDWGSKRDVTGDARSNGVNSEANLKFRATYEQICKRHMAKLPGGVSRVLDDGPSGQSSSRGSRSNSPSDTEAPAT